MRRHPRAAIGHTKLRLAGQQFPHLFRRRTFVQLIIDIGVQFVEFRQVAGNEPRGHGRGKAETQGSGETRAAVGNFLGSIRFLVTNQPGLAQQDPPRVGQFHPVSAALDLNQFRVVMTLQLFQLIAQGRLGDGDLLGRGTDTAGFDNGDKVAVILQIRANPSFLFLLLLYFR